MQRWLVRLIYYPTLCYNLLLGRIFKCRNWWDSVNDHLVLGARPIGRDPQRFGELGITGIVNMCEEYKGPVAQYVELNIEQLWLPTVDFSHPSSIHVQRGASFIERHAQQGGKVYVHCKAGRARSATVALWWLVRFRGMTPELAQALLLKARPHTNPRICDRPVIKGLYSELQRAKHGEGPSD